MTWEKTKELRADILPATVRWVELSSSDKKKILARAEVSTPEDEFQKVREILDAVRSGGDSAVLKIERSFSSEVETDFSVTASEFSEAASQVTSEFKEALKVASENIRKFHEASSPEPVSTETTAGVTCQRIFRPIETVGIYVPAGTAPLPSALLMAGIPAAIAGCENVVVCTPTIHGRVDPSILYTAKQLGISKVFKIGGAQAIGAMAYGTETVPKVDKIFGPGSRWVTTAKQIVSTENGGAAIDMPAGPSEVLVIADEGASAEFVCWDLLSQAEHGPDSQVILVSDSASLLESVRSHLIDLLPKLVRSDIVSKSLTFSRFILVDDMNEALELSNLYAPEHLIIQTKDPESLLEGVKSAGSIFLGEWTPESLGDYASGTNHVLPTYGAARAYSGLSVDSFQKSVYVQKATRKGMTNIGPTVEVFADAEGLQCHKEAVSVRLRTIDQARSKDSGLKNT